MASSRKEFQAHTTTAKRWPLLSYDLCCIFDYRLPRISRSIRSNNRLGMPDDGDNQMKEKDEDIVHPGMACPEH